MRLFQQYGYGHEDATPAMRVEFLLRDWQALRRDADAERTRSQLNPPEPAPDARVDDALMSLSVAEPAVDGATPQTETARVLNAGQQAAWDKLRAWSTSPEPHFVLRGYAGTGKTFMLRMLQELGVTVHYSATTNKAAKVLTGAIEETARTVHSVLGLRMSPDEDRLVLKQSDTPPYLPRGSILVVDEASMVGQVLFDAIEEARARSGVKVLFVGDPAQLPPVGETRSRVWSCTEDKSCLARLDEVMRHDSQLLSLATRLRRCLATETWESPLVSDHGEHGVWKWKTQTQWADHLMRRIPGVDLHAVKVVAWRNRTVERYNAAIRDRLGFRDPFCRGDVVLLAEPVEREGNILAHVDDEFDVESVSADALAVDGESIPTWQLHARGDRSLVLQVPQDWFALDCILQEKARLARIAERHRKHALWRDFWETKRRFHRVRYGYALTAHRAQGSTFQEVYVDQQDVLVNQDKREAYKCLYVSCTRAATDIHSF